MLIVFVTVMPLLILSFCFSRQSYGHNCSRHHINFQSHGADVSRVVELLIQIQDCKQHL